MTEQEKQYLIYVIFDTAKTLQENGAEDITQDHILCMLNNLEVANAILEDNLH